MKHLLMSLFIIAFLSYCQLTTSDFPDNFTYKNLDIFHFNDGFMTVKVVLHQQISGQQKEKWTNSIKELDKVRPYYGVYFYSYQKQTDNYQLISLYITVDDQIAIYLMTLDNDLSLIDYLLAASYAADPGFIDEVKSTTDNQTIEITWITGEGIETNQGAKFETDTTTEKYKITTAGKFELIK